MVLQPHEYLQHTADALKESSEASSWTPLYWHECSFHPKIFVEVMLNLIRNPNLNSNHLFRADILLETPYTNDFLCDLELRPRLAHFYGFRLDTVIVRRLIPRNILVDEPLDQTCLLYTSTTNSETKSLVVYLPHISSPPESPFYHPAVRGIAFLHNFVSSQQQDSAVSIHYSFFPSGQQTPSLRRTAMHLLSTLHKHGQGRAAGYVKRVHHDAILPQATVQNTYARLKSRYARAIIGKWVEATDPTKHVFEDLGIAAFLIELWAEMYPEQGTFPGFVDIGCGNGLLVHILIREGYAGWGFDARARKSWKTFPTTQQEHLKELVLMPSLLYDENCCTNTDSLNSMTEDKDNRIAESDIHSGIFPKGTFIISNHADELTAWTPILATLSESPFVIIPCCSHNLAGARFRAAPPKAPGASKSAYASLVAWVSKLANDCGWDVEREMLRIPSTRNTALLGRRRKVDYAGTDLSSILETYGGAAGWEENVMKLVKGGPRSH